MSNRFFSFHFLRIVPAEPELGVAANFCAPLGKAFVALQTGAYFIMVGVRVAPERGI